jgi:hypothetical protein
MCNSDDVDVVGADAVNDDIWEATNFKLPRNRANSSWRSNLGMAFDQFEGVRDRVE